MISEVSALRDDSSSYRLTSVRMSVASFPPEVIHQIVQHIEPEDLLAAKLVSKLANNASPTSLSSAFIASHEKSGQRLALRQRPRSVEQGDSRSPDH